MYELGIPDQRAYHGFSAGVLDIRPAEAGEVLTQSSKQQIWDLVTGSECEQLATTGACR
jgi:hypothetical protein